MIDEDCIQCPLCEAPLAHEITPLARFWTCTNCATTFTAQELAEEWENSHRKTRCAQQLAYAFPLRPDFMAQFVLPYNLTTEEARRLETFLLSIAATQKDKTKSSNFI